MDKLDISLEVAAWIIAMGLLALTGYLGFEAVLWQAGAV